VEFAWRGSVRELSFEGGAGYQSSDPDLNNVKKENWYSFYVQAGITLAKGVYLYPEIGYWTQDQNNAGDSGDEVWYGGAKWQINF